MSYKEKYPQSLMTESAIARQELSGVPQYPMSKIYADHHFNCRGEEAASPLDSFELAKSIRVAGLVSPVTIRKNGEQLNDPPLDQYEYVLVVGYRRYQAYLVNQHPFIPAVLQLPGQTERQNRITNLTENLKRKDLSMLQEARAIEHLYVEGYSRSDIAEEIGQSEGWVQVRCMILELEPEVQQEFARNTFTSKHARELYSYKNDREKQIMLAKKIKEVRERGDKRSETVDQILGQVKKPKALDKKRRSPTEIEALKDHWKETFKSYDITTTVMSWIQGNITNIDLYEAIRTEAMERGLPYRQPELEI